MGSPEKKKRIFLSDFPDASVGKESPAMQEILVWSLGGEDPLEKG